MTYAYKISIGEHNVKDHFKNLSTDGKILLKCVLIETGCEM
jgi:hypothetical protein